MFATPSIAMILWLLHVSLVIFDIQHLSMRDEKDREKSGPRGRLARPGPLENVTVETHHVANSQPIPSGASSLMTPATGRSSALSSRLMQDAEVVPLDDEEYSV